MMARKPDVDALCTATGLSASLVGRALLELESGAQQRFGVHHWSLSKKTEPRIAERGG